MKMVYLVLAALPVLLVSLFAFLFFSGHIGYDMPDVSGGEVVSAATLSSQCRAKEAQAEAATADLRRKRNDVNNELNTINAKIAANLPAGHYATLPMDNVDRGTRERFSALGKQYLELGNQIEAIQTKYSCS